MTFIAHAVDAVTHADPYPYYAALRAGPPLAFDAGLGLHVASRAEVVAAALAEPALQVRPLAEPVPRAIAGGPAGDLFGRLVRMNEGALHAGYRPLLQRALAGLDPARVRETALRAAGASAADGLNDRIFAMPLGALGRLLGLGGQDGRPDGNGAQGGRDGQDGNGGQGDLVAEVRAFVACLSPLSTRAELDAAHAAAASLCGRLRERVARARPAEGSSPEGRMLESRMLEGNVQAGHPPEGSLLDGVLAQAHAVAGLDPDVLLANLVGLFSQTCDSTAGLIGQAVVALAREPGLLDAVRARPDGVDCLVQEVARHDPPVQNTRRFAAAPCTLSGVDLQPGDAVLVVLAAAHRDAWLNPAPDAFLLARRDRQYLGFGRGRHACPGQALAFTLAACGVEALLAEGLDPAAIARDGWDYRPSVNGRIPRFRA